MSRCKFDGIGRLGADAESATTKNGLAVLSWRMACERGYGDNKQTEWVKCAIFGKRAEGNLGQYLKKGTLVAVRGDLKLDAYTDNNGKARASAECFVDELNLLGSNDNGNSQQSATPTRTKSYAQEKGGHQRQPPPQQQEGNFDDDSIPF